MKHMRWSVELIMSCVSCCVASREYADRSYGTMSFILSYTLSEIAFELFGCVLFAVIAMYVIGMQASATAFFVLLYTLFCTVHGQWAQKHSARRHLSFRSSEVHADFAPRCVLSVFVAPCVQLVNRWASCFAPWCSKPASASQLQTAL